MHIVHVTTLFHPHRGGIESMVRGLAAGQVRAGEMCTVLTRRTGQRPTDEPLDGVRVRRVGGRGGGRQLERLRFLAAAGWFLRRGAGAVDLLHAHSLYSPGLLAVHGPAPAVATVHTAGATGNLADLARSVLGRRRLAVYRKRLRRVIALNERLAGELQDAGFPPERISIIPNGVDTSRFAPAAPDEKKSLRRALGLPAGGQVVAYLGRFVREKGLDVLLDAWPQIASQIEDARLVVAGTAAGESRSEAVAVRQPGHWIVAPPEPSMVLRAADVVCVPSRTEAFGLVAVEAMACGVPLVASDTGGIPDVVGDAAVRVPVGDPQALAAAIQAVLLDPHWRAALAGAGRERALEHFNLESVVARHRELYREVLAEEAPGPGSS